MALGWLSWCTPEIAENTNVNILELAIKSKIDFVKKTNPFGSGKKTEEEELLEQKPNPEVAMRQLMNMAKRRQENDSRFKTKPKR
jgi:hypothetical protein